MEAKTLRTSEAYVDALFGPGMGARHSEFLERIENPKLREMVHRFHALEADAQVLSIEDNYLIGMCVLCATKEYRTASQFAKLLCHLEVPKEKLLEAIARLPMWVGGLGAVDAAFAIQHAISDYEKRGIRSLDAWFPEGDGTDG